MKTLSFKRTSALALGVVLGVSASGPLFAQDSLVADIDQNVLKQQQIDVDGTFKKPDPLESQMKKLMEDHNKMVKQKINNMRIDNEKRLGKKLQKAFSGGLNQPVTDSVSVSQAAVMKTTVAPTTSTTYKKMRIMPQLGYSAISGETSRGESMDFESKVSVGVQFDADVHNHISVGIGIGYESLDITDFSNTYYNTQFYNTYGTNTSWYSNYYGTGRELNSKQLSLNLVSKFFATGQDARFRPYIGLGFGFNHLSLKYANTATTVDPYSIQYGDEQFSANFVTGSVKLGTLVNFSSSIGMDVELSYTKGIGSSFNESSNQVARNIDQLRLNEIGAGMSKADVAAVKAGLTIGF